MKKYVIDACALINASKNYNMTKKTFTKIWETLDELVKERRLLSSEEILRELQDDDILEWSKQHKEMFVELSPDIQKIVRDILKDYPELIKISSRKNSNGDPFLIATAIFENGVVVTDEGSKPNGIRVICRELSVECISSSEFFYEVLD